MVDIGSGPEAGAPRLQLRGVCKEFSGVSANAGVDLAVAAGEIHAVLGENGAGKSTLMKIIYGLIRPTAGEIFWEGRHVELKSPVQARALGMGMVFQHFALFEALTVAENVALGLPAPAGVRRMHQTRHRLQLRALERRIEAVSANYGLPLDPRRPVHALSTGERQRVELIRCLLQAPRLLILDEPTSVLTPAAAAKLFDSLRRLAAEGCSVLYVSHKLDEVRTLCHAATFLRDGKVVGRCIPADETPQSMARLMMGADRPLPQLSRPAAPAGTGAVLLRINGLSRAGRNRAAASATETALRDIRLELRAGEIVGIAGISGNGQPELAAAITGEAPHAQPGVIEILGVDAAALDGAARRRLGLAVVPEERLGCGAVPGLSLALNALLTAHQGRALLARWLIDWIAFGALARWTAEIIERWAVRCAGIDAPARSLSGGNLQKFIVGREILQRPRLLLAAQPTRGLDVGAAALIRQALIDLRAAGCGVLVISEEIDELFEICDRIAVMTAGRLSEARPAAQTRIEDIGVWMSGLLPAPQAAANAGDGAQAAPTAPTAQITPAAPATDVR